MGDNFKVDKGLGGGFTVVDDGGSWDPGSGNPIGGPIPMVSGRMVSDFQNSIPTPPAPDSIGAIGVAAFAPDKAGAPNPWEGPDAMACPDGMMPNPGASGLQIGKGWRDPLDDLPRYTDPVAPGSPLV